MTAPAWLRVDGIRLGYLEAGSGDAILFVHGLGSCGDDWVLQVAEFSGRYRVIAPDLRGHGRSGRPPGSFSIPLVSQDTAALLAGLAVDRAHVVGLSLGGLVAQQLAIAAPRRVRSLTLVNSFAYLWSGSWADRLRLMRRGLISLCLPLERSARYVARGLFPHAHQTELRRRAEARIAGNDRRAYRSVLRAIRRFDSRRDLHRIACPTLVVSGDRDRTVPRACQRQLAHGIPGARWETVRDSGHATPIDQPSAFNALLTDFLGGAAG